VATSVLCSAAVTAGRSWALKTLIEKGMQHRFDQKLEKLRSDLRDSENELTAIRSALLGGYSMKAQALDKRKLHSAETLWNATMFQRRYSMFISFAQVAIPEINKRVVARGSDATKLAQMADAMWNKLDDLAKDPLANISSERLFAPAKAWLAYEAISGLSARSALIVGAVRSGISLDGLLKTPEKTNDAILAVLPNFKEYLEKYPDSGASRRHSLSSL
jgi:uncharacterized coiled-coil protein SlyX